MGGLFRLAAACGLPARLARAFEGSGADGCESWVPFARCAFRASAGADRPRAKSAANAAAGIAVFFRMNRLLGTSSGLVKQKSPMDSISYVANAAGKSPSGEDERWAEMAQLYRGETLDLNARTGAADAVGLTHRESLNQWPGCHALSR